MEVEPNDSDYIRMIMEHHSVETSKSIAGVYHMVTKFTVVVKAWYMFHQLWTTQMLPVCPSRNCYAMCICRFKFSYADSTSSQ